MAEFCPDTVKTISENAISFIFLKKDLSSSAENYEYLLNIRRLRRKSVENAIFPGADPEQEILFLFIFFFDALIFMLRGQQMRELHQKQRRPQATPLNAAHHHSPTDHRRAPFHSEE